MGELLSGWISIGDQMFERVELYENRLDKTFERFVPATYGGPILVSHGNLMSVCAASGNLFKILCLKRVLLSICILRCSNIRLEMANSWQNHHSRMEPRTRIGFCHGRRQRFDLQHFWRTHQIHFHGPRSQRCQSS